MVAQQRSTPWSTEKVKLLTMTMTMILLPAGLPRSSNLPVLNLLTGQKSSFFASQGRLVALIQVKLCRADGHLGPLDCAKFHIVTRGWECGPKNINNFHFLVKSRLVGATPLTDF